VATSLSTADEDSVLVVRLYAFQPAQVSDIRVSREDTGNYFDATLAVCFSIQPGKLIGNPATTLPQTNNH